MAAGALLLGLGACDFAPSADEALARIEAMDFYELAADGSALEITADGPGTLYALAPRRAQDDVEPELCEVDGEPMQHTGSGLNVPGQGGVTVFAFAAAEIESATSLRLSCDQPGDPGMLAAFAPEGT
ncbi:hypothetical protein EDD31_1345 [Bogoriella caseilytica]|uniref:Uncharacterized protein n=1 Tax=Bogoriella caseilytica TaxID=56055 RepID=A0A3N2BCK4_9MICO|nr:hypothetical protein EDD31_1345 [Bogoriella caseilytica]